MGIGADGADRRCDKVDRDTEEFVAAGHVEGSLLLTERLGVQLSESRTALTFGPCDRPVARLQLRLLPRLASLDVDPFIVVRERVEDRHIVGPFTPSQDAVVGPWRSL